MKNINRKDMEDYIKTNDYDYIKTNDLRYRLHGPQDGYNMDLEQRFENIETGESIWKSITILDERYSNEIEHRHEN